MAQKGQSKNREEVDAGLAWYRREQWDRLREVAVDRDSLHETYDEWQADVRRQMRRLRFQGINIRKVDVDLDELVAWCLANQLVIDGSARAEFVAFRLRQRDQN